MTEQIPQWAVERADDLCAQILERATNTDYGIVVSLDARDLIARALVEAAKPGWKPIAEAPKDGRWFLAWCPKQGRHLMRWKDSKTSETASLDWYTGQQPEATHWMPIPDAPEVR